MFSSLPAIDIKPFLLEDIGSGDITAAIIPDTLMATAEVITREPMIVCGQAWFNAVFAALDNNLTINWLIAEGQQASTNNLLCRLEGTARSLLTGERTALNLLQTLSSTATTCRRYADAVSGTSCKILDTRKTIPGLRLAQKYAVTCGGGYNHRIGLYDGILIKENHIIAAGSLTKAVSLARQQSTVAMVEVEVETLTELQQALEAKPDRIMLDNFTLEELTAAVKLTNGQIELEASGNIELHNIAEVAKTGVDFISIGALTKNIKAIDLSMRIQLVNPNAE